MEGRGGGGGDHDDDSRLLPEVDKTVGTDGVQRLPSAGVGHRVQLHHGRPRSGGEEGRGGCLYEIKLNFLIRSGHRSHLRQRKTDLKGWGSLTFLC